MKSKKYIENIKKITINKTKQNNQQTKFATKSCVI